MFEAHKGGEEGVETRAAHLGVAVKLRAYRFDKYRTTLKAKDKPTLAQVNVLVEKYTAARRFFSGLDAVAEGFMTRDLVSDHNVLYPDSYAKRCKELTKLGVTVQILGENGKLGMGALLGVGQGSVRESKMVVMRWNGGAENAKPLAFIDKGVTFDTGGISLKPAGGMEDMKWDMGGSGTVVGLMRLAGRQAKVNVIGAIGLVENARRQRPTTR